MMFSEDLGDGELRSDVIKKLKNFIVTYFMRASPRSSGACSTLGTSRGA
jgi:hypothetical protein